MGVDPAPSKQASATGPPPVEALDRGLRLLERLAEAGPDGLALGPLASSLDLNKSTTHRSLATLKSRDYVIQDPISGLYRLGPRAVHLVDQHLDQDNLPGLLSPVLERICQEVHELVHLGLFNPPWVVYTAKVEPERAVRVWSRVGSRAPAATTALGRAILACLPAVPYDDLRAATPTSAEANLTEAITAAKRRGYASEQGENEPGIACVAIAVLRRGHPRAAVSVTAPTERLDRTREAEVAAVMRRVLNDYLPPGLAPAPVGSNAGHPAGPQTDV
ncbi:MAG: IclR family transcriptional regulator [Bifidobacteriaceae bacterium]|jgi:DNA-binding IclR family transcriptional regulator|nr:IclR family transcriptional regulator [Bifidobacteriaceae bacterium]